MTPVERNKLRTYQILLLTLGGAFMLFGMLRFQWQDKLVSGFKALETGDPQAAEESFQIDLGRDRHPVAARIGLTLAHLAQNEYRQAEEYWIWLASRPTQTSRATRLEDWKAKDPRKAERYEGYLRWTQAWLKGENYLRSCRRDDPQSMRSSRYSDYVSALNYFQNWVHLRESDLGVDVDFANATDEEIRSASRWWQRYVHLKQSIEKASKRPDVTEALSKMSNLNGDIRDESNETIHRMISENLLRAVEEGPKKPQGHAWLLLCTLQLATRKEPMPDGFDSVKALDLALENAVAIDQPEVLRNETDAAVARFYYAITLGLQFLAQHDPNLEGSLSRRSLEFAAKATKTLQRVDEDHPEKLELTILQNRAVLGEPATSGGG